MKAQWHEGGGRILLGDNTGDERLSCCGRLGSSVLEFGFQLDCLVCVYMYIVQRVCTQFGLARNSTCRTFRNVTIAQVGECLCLLKIYFEEWCFLW